MMPKKLVHTFVTSRLDYCNAPLSGCANASLKPLQLIQNAAARILTRTKCFEHITSVSASLHWLPIKFHIDFKVLLITFKALNGLAPPYLNPFAQMPNLANSHPFSVPYVEPL